MDWRCSARDGKAYAVMAGHLWRMKKAAGARDERWPGLSGESS
jgi:hypothetical protein